MSRHSLRGKVTLTAYMVLSIAHASTSLLSKFFPDLTFINLTLMVSTFVSATILCNKWGTGGEEE